MSKKSIQNTGIFWIFITASTLVYTGLVSGIKLISGENTIAITALTVIVFQTINFHHYIIDSFIWKARKKSHQMILKIKEV